jgi:hypothetical protein
MADETNDDWMQKKWRPAMGWMYMVICMLDMAIFPVLWSLLQVLTKQPVTQWMPLTLQGAGLFHLAMGAVLGIAAWGRTQEKVAGADKGTITPAPAPVPAPVPAAVIKTEPVYEMVASPKVGFNGKLAPPQSPQPLI